MFESINLGERKAFALDASDLFDYVGRRYIYSTEINEMFFNQENEFVRNFSIGNENVWLRFVTDLDFRDFNVGYICWSSGSIYADNYDNLFGVRLAFVIDLSKIGY